MIRINILGQGRLDGAFCDYAEADKIEYLNHLRSEGVKNIEMEVLPFAALTHHAGIKAAAVCCAFLDRLKGDQVKQDLLRSLGCSLISLTSISGIKSFCVRAGACSEGGLRGMANETSEVSSAVH